MSEPSIPARAFQRTTSARAISLSLVLVVVFGVPAIAFGAAEPEPAQPAQAAQAADAPRAPERGQLGPELVGQLVRLNDRLELKTSPDDSPLWPGRLAAAIEQRTGGRYGTSEAAEAVPGRELLRRLAIELRDLRAEQVGLPGASNEGAEPPGRERSERLRRILATVRLLNQKLDRLDDSQGRRSSLRALTAPANDACASAAVIGDGTVSGSTVGATTDGSSGCGTSGSSPDIWFRYTASGDGPVTFDTYGSTYDTVLSLHTACPGGGGELELACSDDAGGTVQSEVTRDVAVGEEVWVRVSGFAGSAGNFDLTVERIGGISGSVMRQDNGAPVAGAAVTVYDQYGSYVAWVGTGADGTYTVSGLGDGDYYVRAGATGLIAEIYDDFPCVFYTFCEPPHTGTPVVVGTGGGITTGIDFILSQAGGLSGTVTEAATGDPISAYVRLYSATGTFIGSSYSDGATGFYQFSGLPTSKYFVVVGELGYLTEIYDDVSCPDTCDPTTGTQVVVASGAMVTGIDFALDRLGTVTGTVKDATTGAPLSGQGVRAYSELGSSRGRVYTASDGTYETYGLSAGTYYVRTETSDYQDRLYDDIACELSCDVTSGTPVEVVLAAKTSGIDFSLTPLGKISGTLLETGTGDPIDGQTVVAYSQGYVLSRQAYTAADGSYEVSRLPAGTYAVKTATTTHQNELWNDLLCEEGCDVATGDPISVSLAATTSGIDFSLVRRGAIAGTVTSRTGGLPVTSVNLTVYDLDGYWASYVDLNADGTYESQPLPSGEYYVQAISYSSPYVTQLYDGISCLQPCTVTTGTPVTVSLETTTSGVDFVLDRYGIIEGTLTAADTGNGLPAAVSVLDETGSTIRFSYVGYSEVPSGFVIDRLPPGTYSVKATLDEYSGGDFYQDELYDDVPCEPMCDLREGTWFPVSLNDTILGVDIVLARCPWSSYQDVTSTLYLSTHTAEACERLTAGTGTTVASGADVTFKAGRRIVLTDGFSIESGARFRAVIEPAWSSD